MNFVKPLVREESWGYDAKMQQYIRNAAAQLWGKGGTVITLSGFAADNPLRTLGDLNVWVDSSDYGMVEVGHQFILHHLSDLLAPTV